MDSALWALGLGGSSVAIHFHSVPEFKSQLCKKNFFLKKKKKWILLLVLHYWHVLWELMSECISCAGIFTLIWDLLEQRSISFLQVKKKWAKSKKNQGQKQGRGWSSLLVWRHHRQSEALFITSQFQWQCVQYTGRTLNQEQKQKFFRDEDATGQCS